MYQIRIHGLGGQGIVTSAELIAIAKFHQGAWTQAFPFFGAERTGMPVESYVRIDNKPIRLREHVYNPNLLIILNDRLLKEKKLLQGCDSNTKIIINTKKDKQEIAKAFSRLKIKTENIEIIDAEEIAKNIFKNNIINTIILSILVKMEIVELQYLEKAIKEKFKGKKDIINKNIQAIKVGLK